MTLEDMLWDPIPGDEDQEPEYGYSDLIQAEEDLDEAKHRHDVVRHTGDEFEEVLAHEDVLEAQRRVRLIEHALGHDYETRE